MPARKTRPSADRARLKVLSAADDAAFLAFALDLLASDQRLDRDAALEALVERPLAGVRGAMRALYIDLHAARPKSDRGGDQRVAILRYLIQDPQSGDAQVALYASETVEADAQGEDSTYNLRLLGLRLLAHITPPDVLRYYAVEHIDDVSIHAGEPAVTAIQLLADTGSYVALYQWLLGAGRESPNLLAAFEAFSAAPPEIVQRYIEREIASAVLRKDEAACTVFAEAIVKLELERTYPALASMMAAKISDELYAYLAALIAATNRPPLLAILNDQLQPGGQNSLIVAALRVRTTPEQQAILDRWERRGD